MTNYELFMKMIESMEGLDVSLKIGKESELIIKGDFMKMADAVGTILQAQSLDSETRHKISELEKQLIKSEAE
jgi:hypothetical protein